MSFLYSRTRSGGGGEVLPASTVGWYDAQSLSLNDGDTVSSWPDSDDGSDDLSAVENGATYQTSVLNGNPVVRFNGDDKYDNGGFASSKSQPITYIAVVQVDTGGGGQPAIVNDYNKGNTFADWDILRWNDSNTAWEVYGGSGVSGGSNDGSSFYIVSGILDGASSIVRVDGSQVASGDAGDGNGSWDGIQVGEGGAGNYLTGDLAELLVCEANLDSTGEVSSEEQRMADRWGLTI
jgi:hypothetical protein